MFHSLYQHHSHFLEKPINQLYTSMAIRSFGMSIIGLFIPIYLHIELGYTIQQTLTYFIALALFFFLGSPIATIFSNKFGVKHTIFLSSPFYIIAYALLYLLGTTAIPLWVIGMVTGIGSALFWVSYHYIFFLESDKKHIGEEMGIRIAFSLLASFLGPIFGGLIMKEFGFPPVFVIGSIVLLISSYVVLLSKDVYITQVFSFSILKKHISYKLSLYYIGKGIIDAVTSTIWPLILYTAFKSYLSLGLISSLMVLLNIVIVVKIGSWIDSHSKSFVAKLGSIAEFVNWGIRPLLFTTSHMIGTSILGSIFGSILTPAAGSIEYTNAIKEKNKVGHFVQREMFISFGRLVALIVGYFFFSKQLLLWMAAISHLIIFIL